MIEFTEGPGWPVPASVAEVREAFTHGRAYFNQIRHGRFANAQLSEVVHKSTPSHLKRAVQRVLVTDEPALILCRHGSTPENEKGLIRGWTNPALSAKGAKEAKALAAAFEGSDLRRLYSSDLERAMNTANEIGKVARKKVWPERGLRPWNLGAWQGKPVKDSLAAIKDLIRHHPGKSAPQGESLNDYLNRFLPTLEEVMDEAIEEKTGMVVAVTHSRGLRAARGWVLNGAPKSYKIDTAPMLQDEEIGPGGFVALIHRDGKWRVLEEDAQK